MPALIRSRRTSVFSVLLGVVFGLSLIFCFTSVQYSVNSWKRANAFYKTVSRTYGQHATATTQRPHNLSEKIASISNLQKRTKCDDRLLQPSFKQRGNYWVLYNYVRAEARFGCFESITYATHGDYSFLSNLPVLIERWQGPISVALYAPGFDFQVTLDSIAYLRTCEIDLIRKFVNFHIFFGYKDVPQVVRIVM